MDKFLLFIILFIATSYGCNSQNNDSFDVMTFNIRYDNPNDGRHIWKNRKPYVVEVIKKYGADIVGIQEAEYHQLQYINEQLESHDWFGMGRDDGKKKGEFTAIFYDKNRFEVQKHNTFWCSETPEKPGRGWDAALPRTVTWGLFRDRESGKSFLLYNNHFDHVGDTARQECAKLLLNKIATQKKITGDLPVIVTGDFNVTPEDKPYKILTGNVKTGQSFSLNDTRHQSKTPSKGPNGTFNGFKMNHVSEQPIDFIFVSGQIKVLSHQTVDDTFNGLLPSDHFPVQAKVTL